MKLVFPTFVSPMTSTLNEKSAGSSTGGQKWGYGVDIDRGRGHCCQFMVENEVRHQKATTKKQNSRDFVWPGAQLIPATCFSVVDYVLQHFQQPLSRRSHCLRRKQRRQSKSDMPSTCCLWTSHDGKYMNTIYRSDKLGFSLVYLHKLNKSSQHILSELIIEPADPTDTRQVQGSCLGEDDF